MYGFIPLALSLLPMVAPSPQYMFAGDTACDMEPHYTTTSTTDATENFGDHGWQNYDGNTCTAGGAGCSLTEGKSISKTIGIDFGGGPTFDVSKAVDAGLTFGISVSFTTTTAQTTSESCQASGNDSQPCVCGLQFKITQQRAKGTWYSSDVCGDNTPVKDFDVTSPVLIDGKARTQWQSCRAAASSCSQMAPSPACADGL